MSFALFDQGHTADKVKKIKQTTKLEDHMQRRMREWAESEHILNLLRPIRANERTLDKMEFQKWLEFTQRK
jgi:hypothetical protein